MVRLLETALADRLKEIQSRIQIKKRCGGVFFWRMGTIKVATDLKEATGSTNERIESFYKATRRIA